MRNALSALFALVFVSAVVVATVAGCAAADNAAADRAWAETQARQAAADQKRADADAYATKKEAQIELKKAEAAIAEERRQGFAERTTMMMPMILIVGLIFVALLVFILVWREMATRPRAEPVYRQPMAPTNRQLSQGPTFHFHIEGPKPGQPKGQYWRDVCNAAETAIAPYYDRFTMYDDDGFPIVVRDVRLPGEN